MREAYNISCKGVVVDEETNLPISQSVIHSSCLFQQNIDESQSQFCVTQSDSLGNFELKFSKGYKISMIIEAQDYMENHLKFNPVRGVIPDTIYLKRKMYLESSTANAVDELSNTSVLD